MPSRNESIQYAGEPGITLTCQAAVTRLVQHGDRITQAVIVTHNDTHGLLLRLEPNELIAVRSGFRSGYGGEGARRFSFVLELLDAHGTDLRECEVEKAVFARLNRCALTTEDVAAIHSASHLANWRQYVNMQHALLHDEGRLWQIEQFPLVVPYGLIDSRLSELAVTFWDNPDDCLVKAFRKLEDLVRKRIGTKESGTKVFRQAFLETPTLLRWEGIEQGEQSKRGQLFLAAYGAFRNPRAHRELPDDPMDFLAEFLTINQLFLLERSAVAYVETAESTNV